MRFFPALSSGGPCQYPLIKTRAFRTIVNSTAGGSEIKLADAAPEQITWDLRLKNLSVDEWSALSELFRDCEGRLGTFHFADPTANLLSFSEDFAANVWMKSPLISMAPHVEDPFGGAGATRFQNQGPAAGRIEQILNVPGGLMYCYSVFVRGEQGQEIRLIRTSGAGEESQVFRCSGSWMRVAFAGSPGDEIEAVTFGVELGSSASADLFGAQVDCQPAESSYKKTFGQAGVFPKARFDQDSLTATIEGPNQFSTSVRVFATAEKE